jgi:hypothetical protein
MANINVPVDGRPQFDPSVVWTVNAMNGRWITEGVETMTPGGKYILKNTWPKPAPTPGFSGAVAASHAATEAKPLSPAKALWPHLP